VRARIQCHQGWDGERQLHSPTICWLLAGRSDNRDWQERGEQHRNAHLASIDADPVTPGIRNNPWVLFQIVDQHAERNEPEAGAKPIHIRRPALPCVTGWQA
jgi:hypothetical protein